jgi:pyridoxamine 5'-phosphate oxidase
LHTFYNPIVTTPIDQAQNVDSVSTAFAESATDPIALFDLWLARASTTEPNDPTAAALATSTADGIPSVRMVLVKPNAQHRFCFYTNAESCKGHELIQNPHAALCFHWKSLRRQIRIEGSITELDAAASDAYFHSRSRLSQIGAAVSDQSRPLSDRATIEQRFESFAQSHPGEIPRPIYWRGFCLHPSAIEFWIDGPNRLHDRFLFTRSSDFVADGNIWLKTRLYP